MTSQSTTTSAITPDSPSWAGQAFYSDRTLKVYDWYVLGFSARVLWQCPSQRILSLYDSCASSVHLDVGVGTGFYLDHCQFAGASPRITLLDANAASLQSAAHRIRRYEPRSVLADVLSPIDLPAGSFGSIGLAFVLHCLPGPFERKAAALANLAPLLQPDGVLFGATVMATEASPLRARVAMGLYNRRGIFSNADDTPEKLERALSQHFTSCTLDRVGSVVLFRARR